MRLLPHSAFQFGFTFQMLVLSPFQASKGPFTEVTSVSNLPLDTKPFSGLVQLPLADLHLILTITATMKIALIVPYEMS